MVNDKLHILVVDDDDRIRSLLKDYLTNNQYIVSTAENAEQAKKKLEEHMFDLKKVLYEWMGVDIEKKEEQCSTGSQERYRVIRQTLDEAGKKMR